MVVARKFLVIFVLLSFVAVGAFGFLFMLHSNGTLASADCPFGSVNANCPVSLFGHLDAWRGIAFDFTQIFFVVAAAIIAYFTTRKNISDIAALLKYRIRDWISKKVSELQLLYSLLFSDGILNSKITPHLTY